MAEIHERVIAHLPEDCSRAGLKRAGGLRPFQLDLEAKGIIGREKTKPLRLRKA